MNPTKDAAREISVTLTYSDGWRQTRKTHKYKSLKGAQTYAQKMLGARPEISTTFQYAVGMFGDQKITVKGATLSELFPETVEAPSEGGYDDYRNEPLLYVLGPVGGLEKRRLQYKFALCPSPGANLAEEDGPCVKPSLYAWVARRAMR